MIVKKKQDGFASYLEDTSNLKGQASALYLPENKQELINLILNCNQQKIPFTLSAGRTGTTAGCVPNQGVLISCEKFDRVLNIQKQTVEVGAAVTLEKLEQAVNKKGLTFRARPTEPLAWILGVVATSASGVRGFGYGSVRDYVLEIEVILANGEVLLIKRGEIYAKKRIFDFYYLGKNYKFSLPSYQRPKVKSQAGYFVQDNMDLIDLFIGSEGTLGVITKVVLNLQKIPFTIFEGLIFFDQENDALFFVEKMKLLRKENKANIVALEFLDKHSLGFLNPTHSFIPSNTQSAVYFEQELKEGFNYQENIEFWAEVIEEHRGCLDTSILADTLKLREKIFAFRHSLPQQINEFLRLHKQVKVSSDIAVPEENFRKMYDFYKNIGDNSGIDYVNFGHIGENHLHFNFLPKTKEEYIKAKNYLLECCQFAVSLGGTVSAEHGIGKIKKEYLKIMYTKEQIMEMVELKKYFDPKGLMGRDNIFSKELL